jgi:hypothetical protein
MLDACGRKQNKIETGVSTINTRKNKSCNLEVMWGVVGEVQVPVEAGSTRPAGLWGSRPIYLSCGPMLPCTHTYLGLNTQSDHL